MTYSLYKLVSERYVFPAAVVSTVAVAALALALWIASPAWSVACILVGGAVIYGIVRLWAMPVGKEEGRP